MPGRNFLFVPGPTNVPDRILRTMHRAMEDHRSSAFPALTRSVLSDLKKVFRTESGQAFVFPATGTGMWEAALVNTLSPGDRVLAPRFGQFSHLFIDCAQRLGLRPLCVRQRSENILGRQGIDVVELVHRSRHPFNCARLRCSQVLIVPSGRSNRLASASRLMPSR